VKCQTCKSAVSLYNHRAYDLLLGDVMNDLREQVKIEHVPIQKNDRGIQVSGLSN